MKIVSFLTTNSIIKTIEAQMKIASILILIVFFTRKKLFIKMIIKIENVDETKDHESDNQNK